MEDHDVRRIYELLNTLAVQIKQGFANQDRQNASLRQDISELRSDVRANAAAIVELREAIAGNTAAIAELRDAIAANTAAIVELREAIAANTVAIAELRDAIAGNTAVVAELREAIATLDGKVDRFHRILGEHDVDIRVLKRAVSQM